MLIFLLIFASLGLLACIVAIGVLLYRLGVIAAQLKVHYAIREWLDKTSAEDFAKCLELDGFKNFYRAINKSIE